MTNSRRKPALLLLLQQLHYSIKLTSRLFKRHLDHHRIYFHTWNKKERVKMAHTKETPSESRTTDAELEETATYLLPHSITCIRRPTLVCYLYVRIDAWDIVIINEHSTRRRETTRARPRSPSAESGEMSKVRHVEETPHRMVDLNSSEGVYGSKPGLNLTSRLLRRHGQHIYTSNCIYQV